MAIELSLGDALQQVVASAIKQGLDGAEVAKKFKDTNGGDSFDSQKRISFSGPEVVDQLAAGLAPKSTTANPGASEAGGDTVRISSSQRVMPPRLIQRYNDASQNWIDRMPQLTKMMAAITGEASAEGTESEQAATNLGVAQSNLAKATGAITSQKVANQDFIGKTMGLDLSDPNSPISARTREMIAAQDQTAALKPQLDALHAVSFIDDPIGWVKAQIQLANVSSQYNAAASTFNTNAAIVGTLQQARSRQQADSPGISQVALAAQTAAQAEEALLKARLLKHNIAKEQRGLKAAQIAAEQSAMTQDLHNSETALRLFAEQQGFVDAETNRTKEEALLGRVNAIQGMFNGEMYDPATFKQLDVKKRSLLTILGQRGKLSWGDNIGEAFANMDTIGAYEGFKGALKNTWGPKWMDDVAVKIRDAANQLKNTEPRISDADAFIRAGKTLQKQWEDEARKRDYTVLSADNPYRMNAAMFVSSFKPGENSIADFVRATPNQGAGLDVKAVLAFAAQQAAFTPKNIPQIDKELGDFFQQGFLMQASQLGMAQLGLGLKNPASGNFEYPVDARLLDPLGRGRLDISNLNKRIPDLNLFNAPQRKQWLTLQAARFMSARAVSERDTHGMQRLPGEQVPADPNATSLLPGAGQ